MRSFTIDFYEVFRRVATDCDLDSSTVRYCLHRLRNEGLKFWTVTLPKLAKVVLVSIEAGCFRQDLITSIAWQGRSLRYFRSLLKGIFCLKTGVLLETPDASSLASLRQLCEYTYKLALEFDTLTQSKASSAYVNTQKRVGELQLDISWIERLRKNAETYYTDLFRCSPDKILSAGPRCGPGSIASERPLEVPFYEWKLLSDDVIGTCTDAFRPYSGYFKPYPGAPVRISIVQQYKTAHVVFVPKDSRGPRVISKEPLHTIKPQMAFFEYVSEALERQTSRRVNFKDQSLNQRLALESSVTRKNATLDLKDASDSVSFNLVRKIFRNSPGVSWFLRNCRSTKYKLPGTAVCGDMHALAGMGSGLTFPILAFLVHLSVSSQVSSTLRLSYKECASRIYVYGDDLIVPREWTQLAKQGLQASGLVVNSEKSFSSGHFRESCGGDYFHGVACMPTRLRLTNAKIPKGFGSGTNLTLGSRSCDEANLITSLIKHTHELRLNHRINTADYFETLLERVMPMPWVGLGSPVLGKLSFDNNQIIKQGDSDGYGGSFIKAKQPLPVNHFSSGICPYKYLSSYLQRTYSTDVVTSLSKVFGEIPIPRHLRLINRKFATTEALPSLGENCKFSRR